jgi:hypothetical protein
MAVPAELVVPGVYGSALSWRTASAWRTHGRETPKIRARTSQRRAGFRHPRLLVPLQPRFTQPPAACISHTRSISCFFRPVMHELDTLSCILAAKRALSVHSKKHAMGTNCIAWTSQAWVTAAQYLLSLSFPLLFFSFGASAFRAVPSQ